MPVLVEASPEELALGRVVERDVERSPGKPEPAHAVGQARGREPHLREPESQADLSEHGIVGDPAVVEPELCVPARERAVERADAPLDAHPRVLAGDDEHRRAAVAASRSSVRAMQIVNAAPCAPVTKRLRPLMLQPPGTRRASVRSSDGIRACAGRRLAHRERRAQRARRERAQEALLLLVAADLGEQVHVALVRRGAVQGGRAEQAVPGLLEHRGLRADVEAEAAVRTRDGRRQEPGRRARLPAAPGGASSGGPWPVVGRARLGGHHDVAHERPHPVAQLERLRCEPRVGESTRDHGPGVGVALHARLAAAAPTAAPAAR